MSMVRLLAARYGWRGTWLMVMGTMWLALGIGVLLTPLEPRPWVLLELVPPEVVAAGWWSTGLIAIWQGTRGDVEDDRFGHLALYIMPSLRIMSFLVSAIVHATTWTLTHFGYAEEVVGWSAAWFAVLIWSLLSAALAVGASWPNPSTTIPHPPAGADDE